ncbi:nitric oxide synthase-interacting protein, partial [Passer montanus]|uniref:nitric oxide synthase-interacting protein n=1 Tax=Passer montanus TaxID=9160 RepID=UPI001961B648
MSGRRLRLAELVSVHFTPAEPGLSPGQLLAREPSDRYVCALTRDPLGNATPCAVLRPSGAVVTLAAVVTQSLPPGGQWSLWPQWSLCLTPVSIPRGAVVTLGSVVTLCPSPGVQWSLWGQWSLSVHPQGCSGHSGVSGHSE